MTTTCRTVRRRRSDPWRAAMVGLALSLGASAPGQTPLRPDLIVVQSSLSDWSVVPGSPRLLRFSTTVANIGQGPLHFFGTTNITNNPDGSQSQEVMQRTFNSDTTFSDRLAGRFGYHPGHAHIHFDGWTEYRLRIRPANQTVGPVLVQAEYQSFCVLDLSHTNAALPGSPASAVYNCGTTTNGISVGWADTNSSGLSGQSLDITGVLNGDYWLEAAADPRNNLLESDETNNTSRIAITLSGQPAALLRVLSGIPGGTILSVPVSAVDIAFNQEVNSATFTLGDITLSGPSGAIPVTSVAPLSGTLTFRVSFPAQYRAGAYTMTVGPNITSLTGALLDQNNNGAGGEPGDAYVNTFTIPGLRVSSHTPAGAVAGPISAVDVTFSQPINPATFTTADVGSFTVGATVIPITSVSPLAGNTYRIAFPTQTAACVSKACAMVIGPDINSPGGNAMDQNGNGAPGETGDRYTASFTLLGLDPGLIGPNAAGYGATSHATDTLPTLAVGGPGVSTISFTDVDDGSTAVSLGANTFRFFGVTYTGASQLFVSTNGLITLAAANNAYDNNSPLTSTPPQAAIAVLWDDWVTDTSTRRVLSRFYDANADGTIDWLILQWTSILHYNATTNPVTFRAALALNTGSTPGDILLSYPDADTGNATFNFGLAATVGIKPAGAADSTTNLVWSHNQQVIQSGTVLRFTVAPPGCPADTDCNGQIQPADLAVFVNTWFTSLTQGTLAGDFDGNGVVNPADIAAFVNVWFAALTSGGC